MTALLAGMGNFATSAIYTKTRDLDAIRAEHSTQSKIASMRDMIIMQDIWNQYGEEYGYNPIMATSFSELDGLEHFAGQNPASLKDILLKHSDLRDGLVAAVKNVHTPLDHGVDQFFRHRVHKGPEEFDRNLSDTAFTDKLKQYLFPQIPLVPAPYQKLAA